MPDLGVEVDCRDTAGPGMIDSALFTGSWDAAPARLSPIRTAALAALRRYGREDVRLDLRIRSRIPVERGLGASAAVAAATVEAVLSMLDQHDTDSHTRHELIQEAERVAHGTPSGLDAHAVVSTGPVWFQAGRTEALEVGRQLSFVVADSGSAGATQPAVSAVHAQRREDPQRVDRIIDSIAESVHGARADIALGRAAALGARMDAVHALLQQLRLSAVSLDRLVQAARDAGALGAKLTGGGLGGCIIALAPDPDSAAGIADAVRRCGVTSWPLTVAATS
jgi:mevalonate kinase